MTNLVRTVLATAIATTSVFSACGGDDPKPSVPSSLVEASVLFTNDTPYGREGTVSFIEFVRDGNTTATGYFALPSTVKPTELLEQQLEEGEYVVKAYQRTCPAGCEPEHGGPQPISDEVDYLDAPTARCETKMELSGPEPTDVVVFLNPRTATCRIETGFVELG